LSLYFTSLRKVRVSSHDLRNMTSELRFVKYKCGFSGGKKIKIESFKFAIARKKSQNCEM